LNERYEQVGIHGGGRWHDIDFGADLQPMSASAAG